MTTTLFHEKSTDALLRNFFPPCSAFCSEANDYNASNLVTKTFRPFFEVGEAPNFFKKGKKSRERGCTATFFSRLLGKTCLPFYFIKCESHGPCGMARLQFTLCVTNVCIRKPQQLKNSHAILLSLRGTWYIHLVPSLGLLP